jgi:hypothetical protein
MTCISLVIWWYLATLGPSPQLLMRFETADECWRYQNVLKHSVTLLPAK